MGTILLLAKMAVVLLCFCGIMMIFHYRFNVDTAFAPVFASGTVISILFVGGILNILTESILALYAAGFICFVYYIIRIMLRKEKPTFILSPQTILFFVGCAFAIFYCRDIIFHLSDEFSHWGTVIKEICTIKSLPDARTVIDYKEYPPAAALFAYFFLFATGFSEPICYMAQAVLTFSCCVAFLHGVKWKNLWTVIFSFTALLIFIDSSEVIMTSLLVDYLMPVMAFALTAYTVENRSLLEKEPVKYALLTSPVFLALCIVKTNAIALYVMYLCIVIFILRKQLFGKSSCHTVSRKEKIQLSVIYLIPAIALFLWKNYIDKVYLGEGYDTVKFAITKENILKNYYEKSPELVGRIISDVTKKAFTDDMFITLVICAVIAFVCTKLFRFEDKDKTFIRFCSVLCLASWFIYILGYGLMLVFLMPEWEFGSSSTLICFARYVGTAGGFAIGIMLYIILRFFMFNSTLPNKLSGYGICAAMLALLFFNNEATPYKTIEYHISDSVRSTYEFTSNLDYSLFNRDDVMGFYTGEISEDAHFINNFYMRRILLNKNIYMFNNYAVDGIDYDGDTEDIYQYLRRSDFVVQIIPDDNFVPLMNEMGIEVDTSDGIMYEIVKDRLDCPVQLIKRQ